MTRKPAPRQPAWRSRSRRGDTGPWRVDLGQHSPFVADPSQAPPLTLADHYSATALGDPPAIETMTVTDRETGATFGWSAEKPDRVTLDVSADEPAASVGRLLRDGRDILGLARRQTGGPAHGTGITVPDLIAATVKLWNPDPPPDGTPPTQPSVAAELGLDESGRQVRRIAAREPGPGKPWERILAAAAVSRKAIVSG